MIRKLLAAGVSVALWCSAAVAAETGPDPLRDVLPNIDVVMAHQDVLNLSDAQRADIVSHALAAQARFPAAQRKLEAAVGNLVTDLRPGRVDQARALAQLDGVLARERDIKRLQMTLMIEVKNELTPAQQAKALQLAATGSK